MRLALTLAVLCLPLLSLGSSARAGDPSVATKALAYKEGSTDLVSYLARPAGDEAAKRPGVLVFPDWMGCGPFAKDRAEQLAKAGYVALAVDMYGGGAVASGPEDAKARATALYKDRSIMVSRGRAALAQLLAQPGVDSARVAAIGFCFGGSCALQLARSGADLAGVVSFHGGLKTDLPAAKGAIKARILALHGGADPFVPPTEVAGFMEEMNAAGASWRMEVYGGAVHAFTNPGAGTDPSKGAAFDADAERRSRAAQDAFFAEVFGTGTR